MFSFHTNKGNGRVQGFGTTQYNRARKKMIKHLPNASLALGIDLCS